MPSCTLTEALAPTVCEWMSIAWHHLLLLLSLSEGSWLWNPFSSSTLLLLYFSSHHLLCISHLFGSLVNSSPGSVEFPPSLPAVLSQHSKSMSYSFKSLNKLGTPATSINFSQEWCHSDLSHCSVWNPTHSLGIQWMDQEAKQPYSL